MSAETIEYRVHSIRRFFITRLYEGSEGKGVSAEYGEYRSASAANAAAVLMSAGEPGSRCVFLPDEDLSTKEPIPLKVDWSIYRSHRTVQAVRIFVVGPTDDAGRTDLILNGGGVFKTEPSVTACYTPKSGDYLVLHEGGHLSIIPRASFEEGYFKAR